MRDWANRKRHYRDARSSEAADSTWLAQKERRKKQRDFELAAPTYATLLTACAVAGIKARDLSKEAKHDQFRRLAKALGIKIHGESDMFRFQVLADHVRLHRLHDPRRMAAALRAGEST